MTIDAPAPQAVPALKALWKEAFGDSDRFLELFFSSAYDPRRCFTAQADGKLAGALYWFHCENRQQPIAYLYAVATAKAFRRRGVCHALMAHTHAHLKKLGYAGCVLVPGEASLFRFYESMGYEACGGMTEISCEASKKRAPLRPVCQEEYARLRRSLLPKGGIVQEGENLSFLAAQAQFYAGEGFLLAAQKEGSRLTGLELLGSAAPEDILAALDCTEGTFRIPGDIPFAMYRPLNGAPAPSYFAFAFD